MSKIITIGGFIHCKPADKWDEKTAVVNGYKLTHFGFDDAASMGYALVGPCSTQIELPDDWNPAHAMVSVLEEKKRVLMAEFQASCTEIERQINRLTAIECAVVL